MGQTDDSHIIDTGGDIVRYCLGVDVAAVDSMYCLAAETGEIIFMPVKSPHTKTGFQWILEKLDGIEQQDIAVIME